MIDPDDKRPFADLMEALAVLRKDPLTPTILRVYWSVLLDLSIEDVEHGVVACLKLDQFFPSPSRLRDLAIRLDGTTLSRAATVFEALLGRGPRYDNQVGDYWLVQDVEQDFGVVAREAFIAVGGTTAFRDRTDRSMPFLRRDFLAAWQEAEPLALAGHLQPTLPAGESRVQGLVDATAKRMSLGASKKEKAEALRDIADVRQLPPGDR